MLGIDARVEDLKEKIIRDINDANMPACILNYMLTEILNDVRMQQMSEVQRERKEYQEELARTDEQVKESLAPGEVREEKVEVKAPGKEG